MKTMLLLVMCVGLAGCREKSDQAWMDEIEKAADRAGWEKAMADQYGKASDAADYMVSRSKVDQLKAAAVKDGLEESIANCSEVSGYVKGKNRFAGR